MPFPKFSIVIPTVDRHQLLEKTIAACLLCRYPNLEVLVSDNFSAPDTARVVERFSADSRVRYVRTARRLSMPDHWEFAWHQSTGDYIIINGDDDAFLTDLVDRLADIAATFNAALMSWDAGLYFHPDWDLSGRNTFVFMNRHSRLLFDINPQALFASYACLEIPLCFPQGTRICFSRNLANRAVSRTGRVFWPPYPDYSAPLLLLGLLEDKRYIYWDALAGYGGRSRDSNAAAWDKEQGKTGNARRARDYFDELQQQDIYPHSKLKIKAYCNGHAETLNLLRRLLPDVFGPHDVDPVALIAAVECELRGIGMHNPFLGPHERVAFDIFLRSEDPGIVEEAMKIVRQRKTLATLETWRSNRWRFSWHLLSVLARPEFLFRSILKLMRYFIGSLTRAQSNPPASADAGGARMASVKHHDAKTWLECSSLGAENGLDLIRRFDDVVKAFDRRDSRNLAAFHDKKLLVAAYETNGRLASGPGTEAPSRS